jgi:hypothetical protein
MHLKVMDIGKAQRPRLEDFDGVHNRVGCEVVGEAPQERRAVNTCRSPIFAD